MLIPRHEIMSVMGPGITEVMTTLAAQAITPTGPIGREGHPQRPDLWEARSSISR